MKLPEPTTPTIEGLIDARRKAQTEPPRPHLGCSQIGNHCDRWIWLAFRWAVIERFSGRMLRLFDRGKREERIVIALLRGIGMEIVTQQNGKQLSVDFGGHFRGSIDGLILRGVPEAPKAQHILEIKTSGKKGFEELLAKGVQKAKRQHWAQMQVYMRGRGVDRALYVSVCKDDDRIYTERVRLDREAADRLIAKAHHISMSQRIVEPCAGAAPDWYECKRCAAHEFCHGDRQMERNCRTCESARPEGNGTWTCLRYSATIPLDWQARGCEEYRCLN